MQPNLTSTQSAINKAYSALAILLPQKDRPLLQFLLDDIAYTAKGEQAMIEHQRRVESSTYNGWTNRETWLVGLWWEGCPIERIEADTKEEAIEQLAEQLEDLFHELHEPTLTGMIGDLLGGAVARIEWREIAEHWIEDIEVVLTEEETQNV